MAWFSPLSIIEPFLFEGNIRRTSDNAMTIPGPHRDKYTTASGYASKGIANKAMLPLNPQPPGRV
jgi:hypothetical protein